MIIKRLISNARKPNGFFGKVMIHKMNKGHLLMTQTAIDSLKINPTDNILDIGCGGGNAVKIMSSLAFDGTVCGIDYSPLSVKSSVENNKRAINNKQVEIKQGTVSLLPYRKESFDIVTAIETIYFWENPEKDFREVYRVMKSGGKFCIVLEMIKNEDGTGKDTEITDFLQMHYYTESEIKDLLTKTGLINISTVNVRDKGWLFVTAIKP